MSIQSITTSGVQARQVGSSPSQPARLYTLERTTDLEAVSRLAQGWIELASKASQESTQGTQTHTNLRNASSTLGGIVEKLPDAKKYSGPHLGNPYTIDKVFQLKDGNGEVQGIATTREISTERMYITYLVVNPQVIIDGNKGVGTELALQTERTIPAGSGTISVNPEYGAERFWEKMGYSGFSGDNSWNAEKTKRVGEQLLQEPKRSRL